MESVNLIVANPKGLDRVLKNDTLNQHGPDREVTLHNNPQDAARHVIADKQITALEPARSK